MEDIAPTTTHEVSSETFPPTYRYRDVSLNIIWQTSVPRDDEAALAYFHTVVRFGPAYAPVYCERIERPEGESERAIMLRTCFDPETMSTYKFGTR